MMYARRPSEASEVDEDAADDEQYTDANEEGDDVQDDGADDEQEGKQKQGKQKQGEKDAYAMEEDQEQAR